MNEVPFCGQQVIIVDRQADRLRLVYIRFHGLAGGAAHDYTEPWALHIHEQKKLGRKVFGYFNNDANERAPANANLLISMVEETRRVYSQAA